MARFLEPQEIVAALRGAGLTVIEPDGWRGRCRCCTGPHSNTGTHVREWVTLNGITIHHTYGLMHRGEAAVAYASRGGWLATGDAKTPGPLCLAGIDGDGRIIMVGAGRCNHIGKISSSGLAAMRAASFSLDGSQNLRGSDIDGNGYTIGFELMAGGVPNDVQRDAAVRASAALCRRLGWTGQEVHGHGEVADSRDFSDPGFDMGRFRRDVMAMVAGPSSPTPAPPPPAQAAAVVPGSGGWWGDRPFPQEPAHLSVTQLRQAMEHDIPRPDQNLYWFADQVWAIQRMLESIGWLKFGRFVAGHYGTYTRGDGRNQDDGGVAGFQVKRGGTGDGWLGPRELRTLCEMATNPRPGYRLID